MIERTHQENLVTTPDPVRQWRVLSIPARHPYIAAVTPKSVRPVAAQRTVGWEPDPIFEPGAIAARSDELEVVHLHFSFDHLDGPTVRGWLAELSAQAVPLVLTVHDLRNPHHDERHRHDELLAELIPAAASVITLTEGAAAEIAARFGRAARALPHPSLVDPTRTAAVTTEPGLVVLHLKSLRRNVVEPLAVVEAAAVGAARVGGRLRVDLHPELRDDPRLIGLDTIPGVELDVHQRFDDLELERYLRRAHVTVLPHRWGSHSGWLELARDLGTRVVAPDCGFYSDQWSDVVSYTNNERDGLDRLSLSDAVATALSTAPLPPAERSARLAQLTAVRRAHAAIYGQVGR